MLHIKFNFIDANDRKALIEANRATHPDWTDQQIIDFHLILQAEEGLEQYPDNWETHTIELKGVPENELEKYDIGGDKPNEPFDDEKLPF